jgi:hypothetical protein
LTSPRTPDQAIAWGLDQHSGYKGLCLQLARESYNVGPLYSSADEDWYGTGTRHETGSTANIPRGGLVHFSSPTSPQYGHIAIYEGGGMMMTSSDSAGGGGHSQSVASWESVGYRLRGWKSRINDVEVLTSSGGGGHAASDAPKYVNLTDATDRTLVADGSWYELGLQTDSPRFNLLTGPVWADGQVSVTVQADAATEVNLRAVSVDTQDDGAGEDVVASWPAAEYRTVGGQTQIVFPFTQHIGQGPSGWKRRLRFQIKAWGGGTVKILSAGGRSVYWEG